MNTEELKAFFQSATLPEEIKIAPDMLVIDSQKFLTANFDALGRWEKDIEKCPSYWRLLKLKNALTES